MRNTVNKSKKKIVIAYVPVLHEGYRRFFDAHKKADIWYIFGTDIIKKFDYLRKEIRALKPELIQKALLQWFPKKDIRILTKKDLKIFGSTSFDIIAPREDVVIELIRKYWPNAHITYSSIFLRWNRENIEKQYPTHKEKTITAKRMEKEIFSLALSEADKTSDWWMQVGAVIVKDGKVLLVGKNRYKQSPHAVWSDGDPRNVAFRGVDVDITTSLHAERGVIAEAAKQGISLDGASLYVTDFPCPTCAHMVAKSGIKKLYHISGYGMLDGLDVLKKEGVEIFRVKGIVVPKNGKEFLKYPEKKNSDK